MNKNTKHNTSIKRLTVPKTGLARLNVSNNRLQWFDYAFIPKSLEWIDLHRNQIAEVIFMEFIWLNSVLMMKDCLLMTINTSTLQLGNYYKLDSGFNLRTLDVSHNRVTKLAASSLLARCNN